MLIAFSLFAILAAWILLFLQVDPVPTWFYVLVWYPTLVLLDDVGSRASRGLSVLRNPRLAISLFAWSPIIWLLFEAANLRLRNWYYVFLPSTPVERWTGILLSFATVGPAIFLAERLLASLGIGRNWRGRSMVFRGWELRAASVLGLATGALSLAWPHLFFPLIWGAVWLILDPFVYRHNREWSLLGNIERGEWGRIARLLLSGFAVGLLWETYNYWARGKWIYTVPWLEHTKLFEMPPFGFLGFPVLALEVWTIYHALCTLRVAVPTVGGGTISHRRLTVAAVAAISFAAATLAGMERRTISSVAPRLADLLGARAELVTALGRAGIDSPFDLARAEPNALGRRAGISSGEATDLVESARLATLRGIGTDYARALNTIGVQMVCDLARQNPRELWRAVHQSWSGNRRRRSTRPTDAEVRVWIGAATRACVS